VTAALENSEIDSLPLGWLAGALSQALSCRPQQPRIAMLVRVSSRSEHTPRQSNTRYSRQVPDPRPRRDGPDTSTQQRVATADICAAKRSRMHWSVHKLAARPRESTWPFAPAECDFSTEAWLGELPFLGELNLCNAVALVGQRGREGWPTEQVLETLAEEHWLRKCDRLNLAESQEEC
jgi:hypothetical protein